MRQRQENQLALPKYIDFAGCKAEKKFLVTYNIYYAD